MATPVLTLGDKGEKVGVLQRAINNRKRVPKIVVDDDLGAATWSAWLDTCEALGQDPKALTGTEGRSKRRYNIVRFPGLRTPAELARARAYKKDAARGPKGALAFGARYVGKTENPYGSNRAPWGLNDWQRQLADGGSWLNGAPWCGIMVWAELTKGAGVKGLTSRCASVYFIGVDAAAGKNGWLKRVASREGKAGDAIGLFNGAHVELIEKPAPGGYLTIGGNTSSGNAGSQSNGGGVYRRFRSYSDVTYIARPRY